MCVRRCVCRACGARLAAVAAVCLPCRALFIELTLEKGVVVELGRCAAETFGLDAVRIGLGAYTGESRPMGGFIPAETLVQNGTAGDNGTAGGIKYQPVLGFLVG